MSTSKIPDSGVTFSGERVSDLADFLGNKELADSFLREAGLDPKSLEEVELTASFIQLNLELLAVEILRPTLNRNGSALQTPSGSSVNWDEYE